MAPLHIGKCTEEAKTTVPQELSDHIAEKARQLKCHPSEIVRDALFLALTGETYTGHVAKDRRAAFNLEGRKLGDLGANE